MTAHCLWWYVGGTRCRVSVALDVRPADHNNKNWCYCNLRQLKLEQHNTSGILDKSYRLQGVMYGPIASSRIMVPLPLGTGLVWYYILYKSYVPYHTPHRHRPRLYVLLHYSIVLIIVNDSSWRLRFIGVHTDYLYHSRTLAAPRSGFPPKWIWFLQQQDVHTYKR